MTKQHTLNQQEDQDQHTKLRLFNTQNLISLSSKLNLNSLPTQFFHIPLTPLPNSKNPIFKNLFNFIKASSFANPMVKICLLCLIVAQILLIQAMASIATATDRPLSAAPELSETGNGDGPEGAEAPVIRRLGKHHGDKSVAGGGVIIGGLVTAIFAAVFCYIRVTRKRDGVDSGR